MDIDFKLFATFLWLLLSFIIMNNNEKKEDNRISMFSQLTVLTQFCEILNFIEIELVREMFSVGTINRMKRVSRFSRLEFIQSKSCLFIGRSETENRCSHMCPSNHIHSFMQSQSPKNSHFQNTFHFPNRKTIQQFGHLLKINWFHI